MKKLQIILFSSLICCSLSASAQSLFNLNKPKVEEPCYVYWNGKEFKKGDTKSDDSFESFGLAYYDLETVRVALPKAMYQVFKIKKVNKGDKLAIEGELKVFLDTQWASIGKLCKLENIMK